MQSHKRNNNLKLKMKVKKPKTQRAKVGFNSQSRKESALVQDREGLPYQLALLDPFDTRAEGARIPDLYCTATSCYHLRGIIPISSTPSGTCAFALLPSPLVSAMDTSSAAGGNTCIGTGASMSWFTANPSVYYATTNTNLQAIYSTQRLVAAGWKIRVVVPPLNRAGKIIVVPLPMVDEVPGWNILQSVTGQASNVAAAIFGSSNITGIASSSILALPGAKEYSLEELAQTDILLRDRPTGARAFDFHSTSTSIGWGANTNLSDLTAVSGALGGVTTNVAYDWKDPTSMVGHTGYIIVGLGLSASLPSLDIEYVYHLEGTPSIQTSTLAPVTSGATKVVSNPNLLNNILARVSTFPFIDAVQAGLDYFSPALGAAVKAVRYL